MENAVCIHHRHQSVLCRNGVITLQSLGVEGSVQCVSFGFRSNIKNTVGPVRTQTKSRSIVITTNDVRHS